ncbi:virulence factor TspB C-terminal domain-related protein [Pseudomonas sp. TTU2014-080ASC]|uniref:virulence factor TspB C-terminal domain-related protein n=1 Tax=Pseudomonas sp. TTU2014-080ASC TaxID=1729724 RepID=UPI001F4C9192|nr:virulence factor TspB C-terminal domain-related protein [Pseudomonas sp. TTU2014-080ASC]
MHRTIEAACGHSMEYGGWQIEGEVYRCVGGEKGNVSKVTCQYGDNGSVCLASCEVPNQLIDGQCVKPELDKCASSSGSNVSHQHRLGDFTGRGVIGGRVETPGVVCDGGCQYAFGQQAPSRIYRFVNGDPSGVFADYGYKGNGVSCTGDEAAREKPASSTPSAESNSECTNKVTDAEGRQHFTCTATEKYIDIGDMNCGQFETGGEYRCEPKVPGSKLSDKTTEVEVTEKTNPDGSKDTTTTTTTTTTNCSGVNACSSSTTTSVTNNHTKSDGTPGGESTTCTGPACPDSDGKTQEDREEEQDESESSVSGGQTCDAAPVCDGDAVQCAILSQQYEARCDFEEAGDFEENKDDIKGLFEGQGDKFKLDEGSGDIDVPTFISKGTRFLPASCPTAESFSLTTAGGRTFTLSYEPLCRAATDLSGLFVAVATVLAALYVGRSVGGN